MAVNRDIASAESLRETVHGVLLQLTPARGQGGTETPVP